MCRLLHGIEDGIQSIWTNLICEGHILPKQFIHTSPRIFIIHKNNDAQQSWCPAKYFPQKQQLDWVQREERLEWKATTKDHKEFKKANKERKVQVHVTALNDVSNKTYILKLLHISVSTNHPITTTVPLTMAIGVFHYTWLPKTLYLTIGERVL